MRKKIFEIIEPTERKSALSSIYDGFMIIVILLSILPLCFKGISMPLIAINYVCFIVFVIDYFLRWITADYKYNKKSITSFLRYPFGFFAVIDVISVLPSLYILNNGFKLLRIIRMIRAFRIFRAFRVFKIFRYSKNIKIITNVFKNSKESLIAVVMLTIAYILISALIVFNAEPQTFDNFFEAVYWATISLTTVGYGDICPVTTMGRAVTMISSVFGVAVVSLPAGIITAGYLKELEK